MIRKFLLFASVTALTITNAYPSAQTASPVKQIKAGETVLFGDSFTARVSQTTKSPFPPKLKLKGEPVVVVIELDGGKKGVTLSYNLTANVKSSDVALMTGTVRTAPLAVIEDFPSWGGDNDKEVEVLDPKDTSGNVALTFEGKGSVSLLFDVPAAQAKGPRKLSVSLRTTQPQEQAHSFVVIL
jgi:hypothetical protein